MFSFGNLNEAERIWALAEARAGLSGLLPASDRRVNHPHRASAIHAGSEAAAIDWRSDYDSLTYEAVETPPEVRRGVLNLMKSLGLRFGAFDFLVSPDRGWVFLEVNPRSTLDRRVPERAQTGVRAALPGRSGAGRVLRAD
jgi:hypothetical protein